MGAAAAVGPMVSQVLVDASAFYRLSLAELEAIGASAALLVSPISLCEILSHLDEPGRGDEGAGSAEAVRGDRLRKCDAIEPLADPLAERTLLAGLAGSLDELRDGRAPPGAADSVRRALDEWRRAQARSSLGFCRSLVAQLGVEHALSLSGSEFVRQAAAGVQALAKGYRELGLEEPALQGAVFSSLYPFGGYRLARAQDRLRRTREPWDRPDPGDMEHEHLCRHLHLVEARALVTADPEARSALDRALAALAAASAEVGAEVVALTRAMSVEDVLRAFPAARRPVPATA